MTVSKEEINHSHTAIKGKNVGIALLYSTDIKTIKVRYGISFIDEKQAKANLQREIKDYDVENQMNIAKNIWNQTLNKIKVEGIDENAKAIFYTSLYRTYERMICLSEDNRYYSAFDNSITKILSHFIPTIGFGTRIEQSTPYVLSSNHKWKLT